MESWRIATFIAAVLYGLHNVFTKLASGKISDQFGGLVLEFTPAFLILGYIAISGFGGTNLLNLSKAGLLFSVIAGVCMGIGTVLYFAIFRLGGSLSVAGPLVLVGGVLTMSAVGVTFFEEGMSLPKAIGLPLGIASLYVLNLSK
ncbi:MAG: hypothetical protein ABIJ00_05375 [Candidatus Eisenbacteria bacterium]